MYHCPECSTVLDAAEGAMRDDKPPAEADTLDRVRALYDRYFGRTVPLAAVAEIQH